MEDERLTNGTIILFFACMIGCAWLAAKGWGFVFMRTFPPTLTDVSRIAYRAIFFWPWTFLPIYVFFSAARRILKSLRSRDIYQPGKPEDFMGAHNVFPTPLFLSTLVDFFFFENVVELYNLKINNKLMSENFFKFNIFSQCKKYDVPLRQCPQFLFVVMGFVIMIASIAFYSIGEHYVTDPRIIAFIVLAIAITLLIIAFIITHSFEDLAEANRMKAEFVNIVSHQLRGPLTNLRWATQFLLSEEFSVSSSTSNKEQSIEYFDIIKENGARMEGLIDDLLTITRLRDGKMDSKKARFSLKALTEEIISEHKSIADNPDVQIELKASENLPDVSASYPLIKIVVENLISNAIHYNKAGGKILIELEELNKEVRFQIKDQGIGIPLEDQKRIFQKFFRARNAIRAEVYGTGLGLFIIKLILDGMNGKVWFTSKKDKGSTFYFTLPKE